MLQLVERGFFKSPAIKLADGMPRGASPDVQVLRLGKFSHPTYGDFEITEATLAELKANFEARVRGVDIAVDYFHKSDEEAAGWIRSLYLTEDGAELWAVVDWTPEAAKKLSDREVRYFSPDFAFKWQDAESGKIYKNVLFGGGLTNRPFVKDMAAIVAAEKNQGGIMNEKELKELQAKVVQLSEDNEKLKAEQADMKKKLEEKPAPVPPKAAAEGDDKDGDADESVDGLKKQLAACMAELGEAKKQLAEYAEKAKAAEAAKQLAEKEAAFTVLLTEGKACAAQKEAYIKGDMNAFIKLAQVVNLSGVGHTNDGDNGDNAERILKLAEEKCKADPKLSKLEAIKLAQREIK